MAWFPRVGGTGVGLNLLNQTSNIVTLQPGEVYYIPSGEFLLAPGSYTSLQFLDPISGRWITANASNTLQKHAVCSDGTNVRLANLTGCAVGANVTAAGNGASLTNGIGTAATGLTVTASAGASTWVPVVGGAISPTTTITAGGTNYLYPPIVEYTPPPSGGICATGYTTIANTTVNSVVVVNQGAGYTVAPTITVINDARDTLSSGLPSGSGFVGTVPATLIGNTQVTALYPSNPGTNTTAVPTFTFAPTSAITATMLMNYTVTGLSGVGAQTGYGSVEALCMASGGASLCAPSTTRLTAGIAGPIMDIGITQPRPALLKVTCATNALTTTSVVIDGGFGMQGLPKAYIILDNSDAALVPATYALVTLAVGGINDTSYLQPV